MIKRNLKCILLYLLVLVLCIVFLNWNDRSFPYSKIIYGEGKLLLIFSSILLIGAGFLLKVQGKIVQDILSIVGLFILITLSLGILAFEYDYICSTLHQNTPNIEVIPIDILETLELLCLPLWWFIRLPDSNQNINQYFIILAGCYPSLIIFIGIQMKRAILKIKVM